MRSIASEKATIGRFARFVFRVARMTSSVTAPPRAATPAPRAAKPIVRVTDVVRRALATRSGESERCGATDCADLGRVAGRIRGDSLGLQLRDHVERAIRGQLELDARGCMAGLRNSARCGPGLVSSVIVRPTGSASSSTVAPTGSAEKVTCWMPRSAGAWRAARRDV
jgi:hypothetical protein